MLEVAVEYRTAIDAFASRPGEKSSQRSKPAAKMTDAEWSTIKDLLELLKPFEDGTNMAFSKGYPTISVLIPIMRRMKTHVDGFAEAKGHESWNTVSRCKTLTGDFNWPFLQETWKKEVLAAMQESWTSIGKTRIASRLQLQQRWTSDGRRQYQESPHLTWKALVNS